MEAARGRRARMRADAPMPPSNSETAAALHANASEAPTNMRPPRRLSVNAAANLAPDMPNDAVTPSGNGMPAQSMQVGSLTPLGDGKVHTSASARQRGRGGKDKDMANDAANSKASKPSPRPRTPSVSAGNGKQVTRGNDKSKRSMQEPTTSSTNAMPPPSGNAPLSTGPFGSQAQQDMPPAQDPELRRAYLYRVYRHLRATHSNSDDAAIGRLAANIEMEVCRRATSRSEYVTLLNQEINRLMQAELTNAAARGQACEQGVMKAPAVQSVGTPLGRPPQRAGNPNDSEASNGSTSNPRDNSQQEDNSSIRCNTDASPSGQHRLYGQPNSFPTAVSSTPTQSGTNASTPTAATYSPALGMISVQDVAAQLQHSSKDSLVELICNQQRSIAFLQQRVTHLESYLHTNMGPSTPSTPYSRSQLPSLQTGVPAAVSAEAEMQREYGRMAARNAQLQMARGIYPTVAQHESESAMMQGQGAPINPTQYWERVKFLRENYLRVLYVASQALVQFPPPPNSPQTMKYGNIKHNIALAIQVLSEAPKPVQPRRLEVLDSIERFVFNMVIPIARKFQPQTMAEMNPCSTPIRAPTTDVSSGAIPTTASRMESDLRDSYRMNSFSMSRPTAGQSTNGNASPCHRESSPISPTDSSKPSAPLSRSPSPPCATDAPLTSSTSPHDEQERRRQYSQQGDDSGAHDLDDFPDLVFPNGLRQDAPRQSRKRSIEEL